MKKLFMLVLVLSMIITVPVSAKGKPDHAGGPKGDGGNTDPIAKSVCIDAGHGGSDSGTVSPDGSIKESDLNLDVARQLETILEANGYEAYQTRGGYDETLSNNDRYTFCNSTNATALVSIHHNGSTNANIDYSLGLYHQGNSRSLATVVGSSVAEAFDQLDTFRIDRFPSGVLIKSDMPSMMSEGYFLTNTDRAAALTLDYNREVAKEAQALFDGLEAYYQ